MSKVDDLTRLKHITDAAQEALAFTKNRTRNDLDTDRMLSLALVRLVEIIGEAGNRVSENCQAIPATATAKRVFSFITWRHARGVLRNNFFNISLYIEHSLYKNITIMVS